jgi:thymidylate synthase ThyX
MNKINAEIIADSINSKGCRLTTFILTLPRVVLAELNTHRMLSKNSASSRAIPFEKMVKMVEEDPFVPIAFQKDHKGMQGSEYYKGLELQQCVDEWLDARDSAVKSAQSFTNSVTKQLRNRLLEPFMWHKVILSGTDFENFFRLRAHEDAEIHIAKLAELMLDAYNGNIPKKLKEGDWHIPFGDSIDYKRLSDDAIKLGYGEIEVGDDYKFWDRIAPELSKKIAVARCARISYNNFEGKDDYITDVKLCDRLFGSIPRHLSPTEHVAQALDSDEYIGNFKGFKQYRKFFIDENLTDDRVNK